MSDITAIILTKDESLHIARAIDNLRPIASRIIIVDSHSTDGTQEIARNAGAEVVEHDWPGNQAEQFNWALDNLDIDSEWILRLDADEYLTPELIGEIAQRLPQIPKNVSAVSIPRDHCFMGKRLKHGAGRGIKIIRLFRNGKARYESRIMDEHLIVSEGDIIEFKHKFIDDNRMPLSFFIAKHDNYALREAAILLDEKYRLSETSDTLNFGEATTSKRRQKSRYSHLPRYWRAAAYFLYRYIFRLGFLDGKEGFLWDFMQGWWYRTLVDAKIYEIEKACDRNPEKIKAYLRALL